MDFVFTIAVGENQDIEGTKGSWVCLSPLETAHALLIRIADACTLGADTDELQLWRRLLLSSTFAFERIDNADDRYWRSLGNNVAPTPPFVRPSKPEWLNMENERRTEPTFKHGARGRYNFASKKVPATRA